MVQIPLEGLADSLVGMIPYPRAKIWKNVFYHPDDTFAIEAPNASWMQGAKDIAVATLMIGILYTVLFGFLAIVTTFLLPTKVAAIGGAGALLGAVALIFGMFIIFIPISLIFWYIWAHLATFIAGLVGGSGQPMTYGYLQALTTGAFDVVMFFALIPITLIGFIPIAGSIFSSLFQLALGIWAFMIAFRAVKQAFKLSGLNALFVLIAPLLVILAILVVLLLAIMLLGFFPMFGGNAMDAKMTQSQSYWRGQASPFTILDSSLSKGGTLTYTVQNVLPDTLTLDEVSMAAGSTSGKKTYSVQLRGGEKKTLTLEGLGACSSGQKVEFAVQIKYGTAQLPGQTQTGTKNLIAKCA